MIYYNGQFISETEVIINSADRGFLLGDGLFETLRAYRGKVFCLNEHWQRLKVGADYLEIPLDISADDLNDIIVELLKQNDLLKQDASMRFTLTRGCGPRGILPPAEIQPTVLLTAAALSPFPTAISATIVDIKRNELSVLTKIKSLNFLENVLAKMAAVKLGAQEAILLNSKNHVAETSSANIFIVEDSGSLATPRIEDGALPGITRQVVIEIAKTLNIPITEKSLTVGDLIYAKEIFITNSLVEIQSVSHFNGKPLAHHNFSLVQKIQQQYSQLLGRL